MALHDPASPCDAFPPVSGPAAEREARHRAGEKTKRGDMAANDEILMARIGHGDQRAFEIFAARHVPRGAAVARRIIGNPSDAEEIVQDALLRVWRHAPRWQAGDAQVATWLYRIVVNLALDRVRRNRVRFVPIADADDRADPAPDPQMAAEGHQLERFIAQAIAELPTRQREALTLCYVGAMECADAAQIMQISVAAMESILVRGRRTLRDRLNEVTDGASLRGAPPAKRHRDAVPRGLWLVRFRTPVAPDRWRRLADTSAKSTPRQLSAQETRNNYVQEVSLRMSGARHRRTAMSVMGQTQNAQP
jgi:RNA polymerase sigma-70 factor (ECF subfamily)